MELGTIEREIHIDASPEVVFEVISSPEHLGEWWADEAHLDASPGATGELTWIDDATARSTTMPITVVAVEPPRRFSFRWAAPAGEEATVANSLLVTFEIVEAGSGSKLRMTETGFREMGWEIAVLEEQYAEHSTGWDTYLPRLGEYAAKLAAPR